MKPGASRVVMPVDLACLVLRVDLLGDDAGWGGPRGPDARLPSPEAAANRDRERDQQTETEMKRNP